MQRSRPVNLLILLVLVVALGAGERVQDARPSGLLIRGGELIDGTGSSSSRADVRVRGDVIVEIGGGLRPGSGEQVIEAGGRVVAPGFVDMHSHADRGIDQAPDAATQLMQGITTAIVGQDGGGRLPVHDFFEGLERRRPAINFATAVGHGSVRSLVLGADFARRATTAEIETMKALVDRAMSDGAIGLSSGLEYDPGHYADPSEIDALASVVARHGGAYFSHVRDEENEAFEAWREVIAVGRKTGIPVTISHIKLAAKPVWGRAGEAVRMLEDAKRDGVRVMADWYPYTYWQSSIYVLIPDRDFKNREKWTLGLEEIGGPQNVLVTGYRPDPSFNGRTLDEIARRRGTDPVTLIIEMIDAAGPNIGIIGTSMDERDLQAFAAHPQVLVCSDGSLSGVHPRGYGAFPRVLARYVREMKALSLPEAIAKMTGRSAAHIGLKDRGVIARGRKADIVVFDPATIQDRGTPQNPSQPPEGVVHVIVNGEVALENGRATAARAGRALKR
jgi:N-acyl-D-amino-acid deacylase